MDKVELNNGLNIPCIGYGTGVISFPNRKQRFSDAYKDLKIISILKNLEKYNISLIDTSDSYIFSQKYIGKYLKSNRDKYFICSKISNKSQYSQKIEESFEAMINELKTDYLDLLLLHWPVENYYLDSWKVLERLYQSGKVKSIGVANCNIHHLEAILAKCTIKPMVNQIECHPLFTQNELRDFCKTNKIQVMAYTPTGRMDKRINITCINDIAQKYKVSMAQIMMRWHYQIGNIPIVNTSNKSHLMENTSIFDFSLTNEEIDKITDVNINSRLRYDPDNCDFKKL